MSAIEKIDDPSPSRRIYGRGMFDGLRLAGINNPEEFVQAAKMERLEQGLNGVAKKVLEAVPMGEAWQAPQIVGEIVRQTGSNPDFKVVQGCLSRLVDQGLVREPRRGHYQRIKARPALAVAPPAPELAPAASEMPPAREAQMPTPTDSIDRLASLAATLRDLSASVSAAAKEVEDVAINVEERIQRIHADSDKLRQLQALLKSIGQ